jgi:hypothetical protein
MDHTVFTSGKYRSTTQSLQHQGTQRPYVQQLVNKRKLIHVTTTRSDYVNPKYHVSHVLRRVPVAYFVCAPRYERDRVSFYERMHAIARRIFSRCMVHQAVVPSFLYRYTVTRHSVGDDVDKSIGYSWIRTTPLNLVCYKTFPLHHVRYQSLSFIDMLGVEELCVLSLHML